MNAIDNQKSAVFVGVDLLAKLAEMVVVHSVVVDENFAVAPIAAKSLENVAVAVAVAAVDFVLTVVVPAAIAAFGGLPVQASYLQPHSWWLLKNPPFLCHSFSALNIVIEAVVPALSKCGAESSVSKNQKKWSEKAHLVSSWN